MKYILPTEKSGFAPEVIPLLNALPDDGLFHEKYQLMHPCDVYSSVFEEAVESGLKLTRDVLCMHEKKANGGSDNELDLSIKNGTFHFLFSMTNFLDGCQSIIKSLFEDTKSKDFTRANREFLSSIREYNDYVRKSVNYIKHRHRVVRTIYGSWEENLIIGYYIEGVVTKGMLGPDPDIHNESNCAISLNRDIPYHLCNIFSVSAVLASLVRNRFKLKLSDIKSYKNQDERILKFIDSASKLPRTYFPDELKMNWPEINLKSENQLAKIIYPSSRKPDNMRLHDMKISLSSTVRSRSRSLKLPYFGHEETYINANKALQRTSR
ncbi:hypothetical protein G3488_18315 [Shewanella baltica]|uniref:hypothetical protein n=1 Tax=Shewanella TaxID=22 RepID=UPI00217D7A0B|nr:hypothetical protein [Shewanella baltica]MCS6232793.1 hypothetical protein [Shewanella baltica]